MKLAEEYQNLQEEIKKYEQEGNYQQLQVLAERDLVLTEKIFGVNSLEYGTKLNDYGGIHRDIGHYEKAESAFLDAAHLIGMQLGSEHPDYASVLNNLAGLYRLMGRYEDAEQMFHKTLHIYEKTLGKTHFLYISGLNNLGLLYQDQLRFIEAEALHRQCLALLQEKENSVALATTCNNLANALRGQKRFDEVERLLQQALEIYGQQLGKQHSLYAYGLNNLGAYHVSIGNMQEAQGCYQQAAEICAVLFGTDSPNYQIVIKNLQLVKGHLHTGGSAE